MRKTLKTIFRVLLLIVLPALVLRPVMVCVHNSAFNQGMVESSSSSLSHTPLADMAFSAYVLRNIEKENNTTNLSEVSPRMAKFKLAIGNVAKVPMSSAYRLIPAANIKILRI